MRNISPAQRKAKRCSVLCFLFAVVFRHQQNAEAYVEPAPGSGVRTGNDVMVHELGGSSNARTMLGEWLKPGDHQPPPPTKKKDPRIAPLRAEM